MDFSQHILRRLKGLDPAGQAHVLRQVADHRLKVQKLVADVYSQQAALGQLFEIEPDGFPRDQVDRYRVGSESVENENVEMGIVLAVCPYVTPPFMILI